MPANPKEFYNKTFKFERCKWWHVFNVVSCLNSHGGCHAIVYKIQTVRLWNIELIRIVSKTNG